MKTYTATIGEETEVFNANTLKEAKKLAVSYKRRNSLKGQTKVYLNK